MSEANNIQHFPLHTCPNCELLRSMVKDLNDQLMGFHQAGQVLANQRIELAKAEVGIKQAEADRAKAEADYARSLQEGSKTDDPHQKGPPMLGPRGHQRHIIHDTKPIQATVS